jgi:ATP-dependent RNA helicase DeaD
MHPKDKHLLRQIERRAKVEFTEAHIPTGREICEKRLLLHMSHIKDMPVLPDLEDFLPVITEQLADISKEDLIKRVASLSFSRYFKAYRHAPDMNKGAKSRQDRQSRSQSFKRLFINVGGIDVDGKGGFLAYICGKTNITGSSIGRIELSAKYAFFDVEADVASQVIESLEGESIEGRAVRVNEEKSPALKDKKKKKHRKGKRFEKRYRG